MTTYLVVYERAKGGWGAYSPDVPGCIATGRTHALVRRRFHSALTHDLEGLRAAGLPAPKLTSRMETVAVMT